MREVRIWNARERERQDELRRDRERDELRRVREVEASNEAPNEAEGEDREPEWWELDRCPTCFDSDGKPIY